jgi:hypothetical protein
MTETASCAKRNDVVFGLFFFFGWYSITKPNIMNSFLKRIEQTEADIPEVGPGAYQE